MDKTSHWNIFCKKIKPFSHESATYSEDKFLKKYFHNISILQISEVLLGGLFSVPSTDVYLPIDNVLTSWLVKVWWKNIQSLSNIYVHIWKLSVSKLCAWNLSIIDQQRINLWNISWSLIAPTGPVLFLLNCPVQGSLRLCFCTRFSKLPHARYWGQLLVNLVWFSIKYSGFAGN